MRIFFLPRFLLLLVFILFYISFIPIQSVLTLANNFIHCYVRFIFSLKRFTSFRWFVCDESWRFIWSCSVNLQQIYRSSVSTVICSRLFPFICCFFFILFVLFVHSLVRYSLTRFDRKYPLHQSFQRICLRTTSERSKVGEIEAKMKDEVKFYNQ